MKIGSLFSGYGGLDMAVESVLGGETVWHCEIDPDASRILEHHWPEIPNLGDITAVDWQAVEPVDVLTGGFPCQPVSHAGKRKGTDDERWLFDEIVRALGGLAPRPRVLLLENVPGLLTANGGDAMARVVQGLASVGYVGRWRVVRAADVGAPHGRLRVFVVAYAERGRWDGRAWTPGARGRSQPTDCGDAAPDASGQRHGRGQDTRAVGRVDGEDAGEARQWQWSRAEPGNRGGAAPADADRDGSQGVGRLEPVRRDADGCRSADIAWGVYEPAIRRWERVLGRVASPPTEPGAKGQPRLSPRFVEWMMGLPAGHVTDVPISRNAQLKALGNGVVPQQAELALRLLLAHLEAVA